VPPGPVTPPDPDAPAGEFGFTFDRSGYRVPAIMVSPWVEPGTVYNEEFRHTSLIATLRKAWGLGDAFSERDASARTFEHVFSRDTPRDPSSWAVPKARPVPAWTMDPEVVGEALSGLGEGVGPAIIAYAKEMGVPLPAEVEQTDELPPRMIVGVLRQIAGRFFPRLGGGRSPG
jgi:phospholipase C